MKGPSITTQSRVNSNANWWCGYILDDAGSKRAGDVEEEEEEEVAAALVARGGGIARGCLPGVGWWVEGAFPLEHSALALDLAACIIN